jgi:hypothetical protein
MHSTRPPTHNQTNPITQRPHHLSEHTSNNLPNFKPTHIIDHKEERENMFPQPDAEILARNPQFALLWKDLTTNKINRDGVSKSVALDRETVRIREVLKSKQIEQAKREVIKDAVRAVAFGEGEGGLFGEVSLNRVAHVKEVR